MMTSREVIRLLEADGWVRARVKGSHHRFRHPLKQRLVTVAVHGARDMPTCDLVSRERQSGAKLRKE
jgi:predicted RNA binding protein YcfA (HicA-like mRNA interferase family)